MASWGSSPVQYWGQKSSGSVTSISATAGANVAVGDAIIVTASGMTSSAAGIVLSVGDNKGNTYTPLYNATLPLTGEGNYISHYAWLLVVPSGSGVPLAITITAPSAAYMGFNAFEFSYSGGTPAFDAGSSSNGSSTSLGAGTVSVSGSGPDLLVGWFGTITGTTMTAGSGASLGYENGYISGTSVGFLSEAYANVTAATAPACTMSPTGPWTGAGVSLKLVVPESFTASPTTIPANHAGNITVALAGTGTSWTSGTTFSISGVVGATLVSKTVTSSTAATLVVTTGTGTGSLSITDGVASTTITVATATLAISPTSGTAGSSGTIALTGTNTLWSSETASGLFGLSSSVSGASIGVPTVTSNTSATATLTYGTAAGTDVVKDNSTTAAANFTVNSAPESFTGSPTTIPANHAGNITVALAGTGTSWTSGTTFSISGVVGATLVSKTVTSSTAATLVVTTGTGTGSLSITDGVASTTITVATATLAISPTSGTAGSSGTIALTGTNTLWSSETASGLFGLSSSVSGASIGVPTVTSNTSATATLTYGTAAGTDVVKDASTTATANFTVNSGTGASWGSSPVQYWGQKSSGAATSISATAGSSVTVGNAIIVTATGLTTSSGGVVLTVADGHGNTYTSLYNSTQFLTGEGNYLSHYAWLLVVPSGSGLPLAITITAASSVYLNFNAFEFTYSGGIPAFDAGAASAGSSTSPSAGTVSVSGSGPDLLVGWFGTLTGTTMTAGSGASLGYENGYLGGTSVGFLSEAYANFTTATAPACTMSPTGPWTGAGVSLKLLSLDSYTLSGATGGSVGAPSGNIIVTPGTSLSDTLSYTSSVVGDTFTPASPLTFSSSATPQDIRITPSTIATRTITFSSANGYPVIGGPLSFSATAVPYVVGGANTAIVGVPSANITIAPASTVPSDTINVSSSIGSDVLSASSLTFINSSSPQSMTLTASVAGPRTLTFRSSAGGAITGGSWIVGVAAAYVPAPPPINTVNHIGDRLLTQCTATGSNQATANPLPSGNVHVEFTTVATGTGVVLPTPRLPSQALIQNSGTNALSVYPPSGGTINNGTTNAPIALAPGAMVSLWASSHNNWYSSGVSTQSAYVFYASRCGVPAIANVASPQNGPDGTAALQAMAAINGPGGTLAGQAIKIVIDIPVLTGPVELNAYTTVEGMGAFRESAPPSGLWMRSLANPNASNSDSCMLRNANWASNYGAGTAGCANIVDTDIAIRNLYFNMQGAANVGNTAYRGQNPNYQFMSSVQFYGVSNVVIEDTFVYDPPLYGMHQANISGGTYRNLGVLVPEWAANPNASYPGTTCIQFEGPCTNLLLDGLFGTTSDDFLAFNAGDGNLLTGTGFNSGPQSFGGFGAVYCGNITDVVVRNVFPSQCANVVRLLTATDPRSGGITANIDGVIVEDVVGTSFQQGDCTAFGALSGGTKSRITFRNWAVASPNVATAWTGKGFQIGGAVTDFLIRDVKCGNYSSHDNSGRVILDSSLVATKVSIEGFQVIETSGEISSPSPPVSVLGGTIDELNLADCTWDRYAVTNQGFLSVTGGTVNRINVRDCSFNNINNAASVGSGATVGGINSVGLSHRNANGGASFALAAAVPRFRASGSDTALLLSGTAPTSSKTDSTQDA